jgi:hypothetical protein
VIPEIRERDIPNICLMHKSNTDATPMRTTPVSDRLSDAIAKGVDWLLDRQQEEGFWV